MGGDQSSKDLIWSCMVKRQGGEDLVGRVSWRQKDDMCLTEHLLQGKYDCPWDGAGATKARDFSIGGARTNDIMLGLEMYC